jgi:crossover junction endodeoxyribonuclease RuvC
MFVLGVDPGLSRCGYCILDTTRNPAVAIALGVMTTPTDLDVARRLAMIQADVEGLFEDYRIGALALERVLFGVNVRTAMSVGQASGLIMAAAARRDIPVVEYSPNQVKQAVTGHGAADKEQVGEMVTRLLGLRTRPRPADAADAAAVALCHAAHSDVLVAPR